MVGRSGYVHFDVTTASQDVDLESRGTGWPEGQLRRLEHLAGDSMRAMGYEIGLEADAAAGRDLLSDAIVRAEAGVKRVVRRRSEEHTSELQSLMRISYAVFCLKKKTTTKTQKHTNTK